MAGRDGEPLWINPERAGAVTLKRSELRSSREYEPVYKEAWLQGLLHQNPEVLPIEQIEPGFGELIPLCRELPLPLSGGRTVYLDNLFATAEGRLVLVEAKLWRNHEARRSVIAQAMEYAASMFGLGYEELQSAVLQARNKELPEFSSICEIVAQYRDRPLDEAKFVDAVSGNLSRGRAIIAVVGDGIREELITLTEFLQSHAGHRFTFALVEMRIYDTPQGGARIVVPSVLAQTQFIERGVVQIEENLDNIPRITVRPPVLSLDVSSRQRPFGIAADEFYEAIDHRFPGTSPSLRQFVAKADSKGIHADWQSGLNLKYQVPGSNPLKLGAIWKDGIVDIGGAAFGKHGIAARQYYQSIASQIGGIVNEYSDGKNIAVRTAAGKMPHITDLLPEHEDGWLTAMERYLGDVLDASKQS